MDDDYDDYDDYDDHADWLDGATWVFVGDVVDGAVDYAGDVDFFLFEARRGESYRIDVEPWTLADPFVVLYDEDAVWLADNDDYGDSLASRVDWVAPRSGFYYIEVSSVGFDDVGAYTVTVVDDDYDDYDGYDDHADWLDGATWVFVGDVVDGAVDYAGDVDFFLFEARRGESYRIDVEPWTLADPFVVLYDEDAVWLADNDDYGDSLASRVDWVAPRSGFYYIEVSSVGFDDVGAYTVTVVDDDYDDYDGYDDHADWLDGATWVFVGDVVDGAVDYAGDVDFFLFEARRGESYRIDVEPWTLADPFVVLYDEDAVWLADNDDYGDSLASRVDWVAPRSGFYYIEVSSVGFDDVGAYTVTVVDDDYDDYDGYDDHADWLDGATWVFVGDVVDGAVDYAGDVDFFSFEARRGESYRIDVEPWTLADPFVVLYDEDAVWLADNDDYGDSLASRVDWVAPRSGFYYIEVFSVGFDDVGAYTVTVVSQ